MPWGMMLTAIAAAVLAPPAEAAAIEPLSRDSVWKRAYVEYATPAYAKPSPRSRQLGRLRLTTRDRTDELLLAEARTRVDGA